VVALRPLSPLLFGLLILPLGIFVGFTATPLPFLLSKAGVSVEDTANITAIAPFSAVLAVVIAPVVDTLLRRRTWLSLSSIVSGATFAAIFPFIGSAHTGWLICTILLAGCASSMVLAACGGLLAHLLSPGLQSKASGWWQAGFLGGGSLGGGAILWLGHHMSLTAVGILFGGFIALLGIVPLWIDEPPPRAGSGVLTHLVQIARELWGVIRAPRRRWSAALLVSPIGTGAAQFLLPAIAAQFGVGEAGVGWINGVGAGVFMAGGAMLGVLIPGTSDRRLMYAGSAAANALALGILLMARRPETYFFGVTLYLVTNGFCQVWYIALSSEIVGVATQSASVLFSALNALGVIPLMYMIWFDGQGYRYFGLHGLILTDSGAALGVCAIVSATFLLARLCRARARIPAVGAGR